MNEKRAFLPLAALAAMFASKPELGRIAGVNKPLDFVRQRMAKRSIITGQVGYSRPAGPQDQKRQDLKKLMIQIYGYELTNRAKVRFRKWVRYCLKNNLPLVIE